VLASPFCGASSDALILLAEAGRTSGRGLWGAVQAAGGDAVEGPVAAAGAGGEAPAGGVRAAGRDGAGGALGPRGPAAGPPEAREGEAALESEGLDAVRLMTIHRAKGLEFPVVCVADLGRKAGGTRPALLVGGDGTAGLRLAPLGGGETVPTAAWERLAEQEA